MVTLKTRFAVLTRDAFTCQYCGRKAPSVVLEVDHKIPRCKGGTDHASNLLTACWDCNHGKGDGEPEKEASQGLVNGADGWSFMRNWWHLHRPSISLVDFYKLAKTGLVTTACCRLNRERNIMIHESGRIVAPEDFLK